MLVSLLVRWIIISTMLTFTNHYLEDMRIYSPFALFFSALLLALTAYLVDRGVTSTPSPGSIALVNLFLFSLVLLTLSALFPRFIISSTSALTVGLLLAGCEWLLHRYFPKIVYV